MNLVLMHAPSPAAGSHEQSQRLLRYVEMGLSWSSGRLPDWLQFPSMYGKTKERWLELCEQAANEQDSAKLKALVEDIARLLKEKEDRLKEIHRGIQSGPACGKLGT